ncbi:LacI family DNA-binding transcriptional regulator [Arthrobacter sp. SLBN-112]|uniref:LacI family DNA-binding transcriptional regulator n=1 Tax=Arthrobacter sp. SLBN-112 TaxID=2768452 RepID=UPI0027B17B6C|nr:LacI family DNA-binding transcriptional regulator [Arthrobacter sp. SLBN-112]MDQ0801407.1 DNA-binding LacI/PurR family transcriptional regulator [Arthrobacter sp. SLBN-112]
MVKGPTVYDVAELAGVSIATVSFTYSKPHRVRETTRNSVLAAARELGYVPSASARGLAKGRTGALGLFSFDFLNLLPEAETDRTAIGGAPDDFLQFPIWVDEVQRGVELECFRRGYALMIGGGNKASGERAVTDIAGRVDGLIIFPNTIPAEVARRISARIPVVELSDPSGDSGLHRVTIDNASGIRQLMEHLIGVHKFRKFMFVSIPNAETEVRYNAFRSALHAHGLDAQPPLESWPDSRAVTAELIAELQDSGSLPDCFVCANDQEAVVVLENLKAAGIRVPNQVAVTGYDGILAGRLVKPTLTTVRQPMELIGRTAVEILADALADPLASPAHRQLPVSLAVRESCGCCIDGD